MDNRQAKDEKWHFFTEQVSSSGNMQLTFHQMLNSPPYIENKLSHNGM